MPHVPLHQAVRCVPAGEKCMRRKRNRSTNEVMTLVSAGGNESEGTSELARSYGRRILREVKYCTEKIDFLLTILTSEEREQLAQSIAEFAATAGHPTESVKIVVAWFMQFFDIIQQGWMVAHSA